MGTVFELRALANMNERTSCPRCQGYGFKHDSWEKHDKPQGQRCKKCIDCPGCDASGIIIGKAACNVCNAKGYIHTDTALTVHPKKTTARCPDCIDCKECQGRGVISKEKQIKRQAMLNMTKPSLLTPVNRPVSMLPTTSRTVITMNAAEVKKANLDSKSPLAVPSNFNDQTQPPAVQNNIVGNSSSNASKNTLSFQFPPTFPIFPKEYLYEGSKNSKKKSKSNTAIQKFLPASVEKIHPHMMNSTIVTALAKILESGSVEEQETEETENKSKSTPCPRCEGCGFFHVSPEKHDKPLKIKCKNCGPCKGCSGTGEVVGKIPCESCKMQGFVHTSQERQHDAPNNLRCFFCADCKYCKGLGLVDALAVPGIKSEKHKSSHIPEDKQTKRRSQLFNTTNTANGAVGSSINVGVPQYDVTNNNKNSQNNFIKNKFGNNRLSAFTIPDE